MVSESEEERKKREEEERRERDRLNGLLDATEELLLALEKERKGFQAIRCRDDLANALCARLGVSVGDVRCLVIASACILGYFQKFDIDKAIGAPLGGERQPQEQDEDEEEEEVTYDADDF